MFLNWAIPRCRLVTVDIVIEKQTMSLLYNHFKAKTILQWIIKGGELEFPTRLSTLNSSSRFTVGSNNNIRWIQEEFKSKNVSVLLINSS
jgi:hypothetical protein